jgi:uncharacterized membrane protein YdjX (TVP38/TMEM64 family)
VKGYVGKVIVAIASSLLLPVVAYLLFFPEALADPYGTYRNLVELFADRKRLRALVLSYGDLAPLIFIGLQVTQVVISFIPGEATGFLGGFIFGILPGFVYSCIGLTIGSLIAFGLSRWLGMRFVRRIVRPALYQKFAFLQEPRGIFVIFVFFLIPGFPKDTLSYILGVTPIPLWAFFVTMTLGRMPGTWLLSIQGAKFQAGETFSWVLLVAVGAFLLLMGYLYRDRIMVFARRHWGDFR